jgi:hypothetical protein
MVLAYHVVDCGRENVDVRESDDNVRSEKVPAQLRFLGLRLSASLAVGLAFLLCDGSRARLPPPSL